MSENENPVKELTMEERLALWKQQKRHGKDTDRQPFATRSLSDLNRGSDIKKKALKIKNKPASSVSDSAVVASRFSNLPSRTSTASSRTSKGTRSSMLDSSFLSCHSTVSESDTSLDVTQSDALSAASTQNSVAKNLSIGGSESAASPSDELNLLVTMGRQRRGNFIDLDESAGPSVLRTSIADSETVNDEADVVNATTALEDTGIITVLDDNDDETDDNMTSLFAFYTKAQDEYKQMQEELDEFRRTGGPERLKELTSANTELYMLYKAQCDDQECLEKELSNAIGRYETAEYELNALRKRVKESSSATARECPRKRSRLDIEADVKLKELLVRDAVEESQAYRFSNELLLQRMEEVRKRHVDEVKAHQELQVEFQEYKETMEATTVQLQAQLQQGLQTAVLRVQALKDELTQLQSENAILRSVVPENVNIDELLESQTTSDAATDDGDDDVEGDGDGDAEDAEDQAESVEEGDAESESGSP